MRSGGDKPRGIPITTTEVRLRIGEFNRSIGRLRQDIENTIDHLIDRMLTTPIQFRFPRSKKKQIQKKWRKDPRNFRKLVDDGFPDIQIVGMGG